MRQRSPLPIPCARDRRSLHVAISELVLLSCRAGGGSANKTFLFQQTKALLNEKSLVRAPAPAARPDPTPLSPTPLSPEPAWLRDSAAHAWMRRGVRR